MKIITFTALSALLFTSCEKQETTKEDSLPKVEETLEAAGSEKEAQADKVEAEKIPSVDELKEYKRLNDLKQACQINLSSIQKAMRAYCNIHAIGSGVQFDSNKLTEIFGKLPLCPLDDSPYIYLKEIPGNGTPFAKCPHCDTHGHKPKDVSNW